MSNVERIKITKPLFDKHDIKNILYQNGEILEINKKIISFLATPNYIMQQKIDPEFWDTFNWDAFKKSIEGK